MGDYIDREATIGYIEKKKRELGITNCNACNFKDILRAQPAADVRPVVRGQWVKIYEDKEPAVEQHQVGVCCSKCMKMPEDKFMESEFCPHCGADMRGE